MRKRGKVIHWSGARDRREAILESKRDHELLKSKTIFEAAEIRSLIEKHGKSLTAWEVKFLTSLWKQTFSNKRLTQKQRFFLRKIQKKFAEITSSEVLPAKTNTKKHLEKESSSAERSFIVRKAK